MKNPWKKISSKDIYDNPWISVKEDEVVTPTGTEGIYGTVSFKNYAIAIIPIDEEGFTYLVGQYRYPLDIYSWEIPMGGGLKNQDILESAKRELKEETGLVADNWQQIMTLHLSNSVTDETGFTFLATGLTQKAAEPDETEKLKIKKIKIEEAIQMAIDNKITDALSVASLLKAKLILDL